MNKLFPTPGLPLSNVTDPGTTPPPNTRISSGSSNIRRALLPGEGAELPMSHLLRVASARFADLDDTSDDSVGTYSCKVPHDVQLGHLPCHFEVSFPQVEHLYADFEDKHLKTARFHAILLIITLLLKRCFPRVHVRAGGDCAAPRLPR